MSRDESRGSPAPTRPKSAPSRGAAGGPGARLAALVYRALLRAYPPEFRRRYGDQLQAFFEGRLRQHRRSAPGPLGWLRFWAFHLEDLLVNASTERFGSARRPPPPRRERQHVDPWIQDIKHSARTLAASPGFSTVAILLIALGIGANVAIFSIVDAMLWRPRPFADAEELVWVYQDADDGEPSSTSYPAYLDMTEFTDVFAGVTAFIEGWGASYMDEAGNVHSVRVGWITSSYPRVLGLPQPALGRWFVRQEDDPDGTPAAMVSHEAWQTRFGADPDVVGSTVRLNGKPLTVVGVAPQGYRAVEPNVEVGFWMSISAMGHVGGPFFRSTLDERTDHWFRTMARLRPGVSPQQAQAAMEVLERRLAADYPDLNEGRDITVFTLSQVRVHPDVDGEIYPVGGVLLGIVGLVLIVACANLANVMLARASTRGREVAIRTAIGATRSRLVRLLLTESVMLALGGCAVGLVLAAGAGRLFEAYPPDLPVPIVLDIALDARVLLFAVLLSVGTGIAFGLAPALRAARTSPVANLKDPDEAMLGRMDRRGRRWLSLRNALVVGQVAISLVLLMAAGLMVRSLVASQNVDPGFRVEGLAVLQADPRQAGYEDGDIASFYRRLLTEVEGLPGVEAVGRTTRLPLTPGGGSSTLVIDEYRPASGTGNVEVRYAQVDESYFETMGIPILHGRALRREDDADAPAVAVISEAMARRYWGRSDVVGRQYRHQNDPDTPVTIVGVAADVIVGAPGEEPQPFFYRTVYQWGGTRLFTVARTSGDVAETAALMRERVRELDRQVPVFAARTMREHAAAALAESRTAARFLGGFSALALLLASLGVYGVVSFSVARRRSEVGIRMALGARGGQVVASMIREVMAVVAVGVVFGSVLSLLATPVLEGMLYGVAPGDPLTLAGVAALLAIVALVAAWVPARRAAGLDPMLALRRG